MNATVSRNKVFGCRWGNVVCLLLIFTAPPAVASACPSFLRALRKAAWSESTRAQVVKTVALNSLMLAGTYYPLYLPPLKRALKAKSAADLAWRRVRLAHQIGLAALGVYYGGEAYRGFQQALDDDKKKFLEQADSAALSVPGAEAFKEELSQEIQSRSRQLSPEAQAELMNLLEEAAR